MQRPPPDVRTIRLIDSRPPLTVPAMSNQVDRHSRFGLNSRWIEIDGKPALPVTGELHYSRIPRARWEETLRLMVASGLTSVSTYVFWIHHEPVRGQVSFDGDLDIAAFLETAERVGVDVIVRIGPWCHGEVRNGGHPDWVVEAAPGARTNDPVYLELAQGWYEQVAAQVARFCGPDRRVIGIQIENELYDQPEHIATLKQLARDAGLSAPLWTATGWGGAILPAARGVPPLQRLRGRILGGSGLDVGRQLPRPLPVHPRLGRPGRRRRLPRRGHRDRRARHRSRVPAGDLRARRRHGHRLSPPADRARPRHRGAWPTSRSGTARRGRASTCTPAARIPPITCRRPTRPSYPNDLPRFDYDFQAAFGATGHPGAESRSAARPQRVPRRLRRSPRADVQLAARRRARRRARPGPRCAGPCAATATAASSSSTRISRTSRSPALPMCSSGSPWAVRTSSCPTGRSTSPAGSSPAGRSASSSRACGSSGRRHPSRASSRARFRRSCCARTTASPLASSSPPASRIRTGGRGRASPTSRSTSSRATSLLANDALRILVVDERQAERLWYLGEELIDSVDAVWRRARRPRRSAQRTRPTATRWTGARFEPIDLRTASAPGLAEGRAGRGARRRRPPARYGEFMGGRRRPPTRRSTRSRRSGGSTCLRRGARRRRSGRARHRVGGRCRAASRGRRRHPRSLLGRTALARGHHRPLAGGRAHAAHRPDHDREPDRSRRRGSCAGRGGRSAVRCQERHPGAVIAGVDRHGAGIS